MKAAVLAYHSHRVLGSTYESNDHIALAADLETLDKCGYEIVGLPRLCGEIDRRSVSLTLIGDRRRLVALTFDDGPEYDAIDFAHPEFGPQRSFLRLMHEFGTARKTRRQRRICATSFVIASPAARQVMEKAFDPAFHFLTEGSMNDRWWNPAIDSGMMAIANHSWDHLHPALASVAHSRQQKGSFRVVDNERDAQSQIDDAWTFINDKTLGRAAPYFAFPFGQYNDYLVDSYLPHYGFRHRMLAAFSTAGRMLDDRVNRWCIPRLTSGDHWKTPDEFAALLL